MALADKAHLIADVQADMSLAVALAQSAVQYQLDLLQDVSDAAGQRLVRDQDALYDFRVARANADLAWRTAAAGKQFVDGTAPAVQGFEGCTPSSMGGDRPPGFFGLPLVALGQLAVQPCMATASRGSSSPTTPG